MEAVPSHVFFHAISFLPVSLFLSPSKQAGQVIWKEVVARQDKQFKTAEIGIVGLLRVDGGLSL